MSLFANVNFRFFPPTTGPHRPLHVEEVPPQEYPKIAQIANEWKTIAEAKQKITSATAEPRAHAQFADSIQASGDITKILNRLTPEQLKLSAIFACKDAAGEICGLGIATAKSRNRVYGEYLVTHPINIRCKANAREPKRVEGVGRAFLALMDQKMAQGQINSLYLYPLESAETFYLNFGFTHNGDNMTKSLTPPDMLSHL